MDIIEKALSRFKELVESLECECDPYNGFTCPLHNDMTLVKEAIAKYTSQPAVESDADDLEVMNDPRISQQLDILTKNIVDDLNYKNGKP